MREIKLDIECQLTVQPKPVMVRVGTTGIIDSELAEIPVDVFMETARKIAKMLHTRDGTTRKIEDLLTQASLQLSSSEMDESEREDADFEGGYNSLIHEIVRPMARILKGLIE